MTKKKPEPLPDPAIVRLIEMTERRDLAGVEAAPFPEQLVEHGAQTLHMGAARIKIEPSRRNEERFATVSGFGLDETVSRSDFDAIIDSVMSQNVDSVRFYSLPGPQQREIAAWLQSTGFARGTRFVRWMMPTAEAAAPLPGFDIRRIGPDEGMAFAQIVAVNYHFKRGIDLSWLAAEAAAPGYATFLAYEDGKPIATGRLHGADNSCVLGYGTTLRAYRGRGIQGEIIAARVHHANDLGYEWATASTMGYDRSSRNLARQGFRKAYEAVVFRR